MKKLLFTLMACFIAFAANAQTTLYVVGNNINGSSNWGAGSDNKMTYNTSEGCYEWTGTELGTGFKFNNGGWNNATYNIGEGMGGAAVTLGSQYTLYADGGSSNIPLSETVYNPVIKLYNVGQKNPYMIVTGEVSGQKTYPTLFLRGSIVDSNWSAKEEFKFAENEGVYTLELDELSGQFKLADANWGNEKGGSYKNKPVTLGDNTLDGTQDLTCNGETWKNVTLTFYYDTNVLNIAAKTVTENDYDEIYVIGDFINGGAWNEDLTQYPLTLKEGFSNVYEGTFTANNPNGNYFKLKAGTLIYGVTDSDQLVTLDSDYTAIKGGDKAFQIGNGEYNVKFVLNKNAESGTLTVSGEGEEVEIVYYLRGSMNEWGTNLEFKTEDKENFVLEGVSLAEGDKFKISDGNWTASNTYSFTDEPILLNKEYTLEPNMVDGGANMVLATSVENGTITFNIKNRSFKITGIAANVPEVIYLKGDFNDWDGTGYEMNLVSEEKTGNGEYIYEITMDSLNEKFKICNTTGATNWGYINYGAKTDSEDGVVDITEGDTFESVYNGGNFYANNLTNVTLRFFYNPDSSQSSWLHVSTNLVPSVHFDVLNEEDYNISDGVILVNTEKETVTINVKVPNGYTVYYLDTPTSDLMLYAENGFVKATNGQITLNAGKGTLSVYASKTDDNTHTNTVSFNYNVGKDVQTAVDSIEVEGGEAVYFNLQGQKVANPDKGIFVKVQNGKAVKVVK